jgi:hypothetical protein
VAHFAPAPGAQRGTRLPGARQPPGRLARSSPTNLRTTVGACATTARAARRFASGAKLQARLQFRASSL